MPIHDWSRVDAAIFHDFHQAWTIEIRNALNSGGLPPDYYALTEQFIGGAIPDVLALKRFPMASGEPDREGGVAIAEAPPKACFTTAFEEDVFAWKANRISVRHRLGDVVAVIEIVSAGNKSSHHALTSFVKKTYEFLTSGVNLLVVDLFPPSIRDPQGIHKAIWQELRDEPYEQPAGKPLTVAAYAAGMVKRAYVEPVAVGDLLPSLPIFLDEGRYVPAPLESTYEITWAECPAPVREMVLNPQAG
jgi:hypothetical protein